MSSAQPRNTVLTLGIGIVLAVGGVLDPYLPNPASVALAASQQVVALNNEGVKALNAGNYSLAIQKFEQAMKMDPSYNLARENLAIAYNNYGLQLQNNPGQAIKQFHKSLALNPNNPTTQSNLDAIVQMLGKNPRRFEDRVALGKAARLAGDFEGAIVEYSAALRLQNDPQLHVDLGDVYRVRDRVDDAIREFKAALSSGIDPSKVAEVQVKLGQSYQAKKDLQSAIAAYGEALKARPDDPDVLDALQAGWEEALRENPQAPENHIGLGQAFQYRGDFSQAEAEYRMALQFDRNNAIAKRLLDALPEAKRRYRIDKHINAGVDLQARKLYDAAVQEYMAALQDDPRNVSVLVNIGTALQAKEDFDRAIEFYQKAQALEPSNALAAQGIKAASEAKREKVIETAIKAGADLFKAGKYEEALEQYRKVAAATPNDAANHFNMGAVLQAMKRLDEAIAEYRQAIRLDKNNKEYTSVLEAALKLKAEPIIEQAVAKHKAKDYPAAISLYTQAISLTPNNPSLYFNLAGALYSREQYPEAKKHYEKALELDRKGQIDDLWLIGTIEEHFGDGYAAMNTYRKYITEAPGGKYIAAAKERVEALTKNPKATVKIKTEAELAMIKDAADAYKAGTAAYEAKNFDEALAKYSRASELMPQEPAYAYAVGTAYHARQDLDNAISWYKKSLSLLDAAEKKDAQLVKGIPAAIEKAQADKADPLVQHAVEKQNAGDLATAIDLYKQALVLIPKNATVWTNLGSAYQNSDDFANARTAYQKALDLDKKSQCANYYLIAAIDEHFGKGSDALVSYRKYVTECGGGQFAQAANDRIKVLAANPNQTQKLSTQAEIKVAQQAQEAFDAAVKAQESKQWDQAIAGFQKAVQLMPQEAAFVFALGTAYQGKEDYTNAVQWYQKALDLATRADLKEKYKDQVAEYSKYLRLAKEGLIAPVTDEALQLFEAKNYAAAAAKYREALAQINDDPGIYVNLGAALQASDDFAGARDAYRKAYELDQKGQIDLLYLLGTFDEHFGQGQQALQKYRDYMTKAPQGKYVEYARNRVQELSQNINATVKLQTQSELEIAQEEQDTADEADKLLSSGKAAEAIPLYEKLTRMKPNEAAYWYNLGAAYQTAEKIDDAIRCYSRAVQLAPKNESFAQVLAQAKQIKAAPILEEAVKLHTAGDLAGAVELYRKALAEDPSYAKAYTNLATALQSMDDFAGALQQYQKAYSLDPKGEVENLLYIAKLNEHFGKASQAIQDYTKFIQQAPQSEYAADAKARIQALQSNPSATQKLATTQEIKKAEAGNAAFNEAVQLQQAGQLEEAIAKYDEALQALPAADNIWYSKGTAYQAQGDLDKALECYTRASNINPSDTNYKTWIKNVRAEKARPLVESAIAKQTTEREDKSYDIQGAIADYEAALKIDDDAGTHMNLGTAYQALGNFQKALEHYNRAWQMDNKLVDVLYYRATLYENMKQKAPALQDYKRYVQMSPDGPNAGEAKERIKVLGTGR